MEKGKPCELRDNIKTIANLEAGNPPLFLTCSTLVADLQDIPSQVPTAVQRVGTVKLEATKISVVRY
jgi:hypothetical protein